MPRYKGAHQPRIDEMRSDYMSVAHRLDPLFNFDSIAVVGASDSGRGGPRGLSTLKALGFKGTYYPINHRAETVGGMKAYPNVSALPEVPGMVLIAIPGPAVP